MRRHTITIIRASGERWSRDMAYPGTVIAKKI
jgi:hypothetical protein